MSLSRVCFLAGHTTRSQSYAQAMLRCGLHPGTTLLLGSPGPEREGEAGMTMPGGDGREIELPDLSQPLQTTLAEAAWSIQRLATEDVNHQSVADALDELQPDLVIYSGYGGQIVRPHVLDLGFPFLHLHSGWLPDFRGSTTLYYSVLKEGTCGVTAILLRREIDTGPIVDRRHYPAPPLGIDVDHVYDGAIRADLLVRVLDHYVDTGHLALSEQPSTGETFYVIHPVLKHVALLSLGADRCP